jgi:hypothetical protein
MVRVKKLMVFYFLIENMALALSPRDLLLTVLPF